MRLRSGETRWAQIVPTNDEERRVYHSAAVDDEGAWIIFQNLTPAEASVGLAAGLALKLATSAEAAALEGLAHAIRAELLEREQRRLTQTGAGARGRGTVPEGTR